MLSSSLQVYIDPFHTEMVDMRKRLDGPLVVGESIVSKPLPLHVLHAIFIYI